MGYFENLFLLPKKKRKEKIALPNIGDMRSTGWEKRKKDERKCKFETFDIFYDKT